MDKKNKKSRNYIYLILIVIILLIVAIFNITCYQKFKKNDTIYCIIEDESGLSKMEMYYDFKDGSVYRYSIINTQPYSENIKINDYLNSMESLNNKYVGVMEKVWYDEEKLITMESFILPLLSEDEFKGLTGISKKELLKQTRKEIIDSIIFTGNQSSNYKCS